jgi:hypothetical protein
MSNSKERKHGQNFNIAQVTEEWKPKEERYAKGLRGDQGQVPNTQRQEDRKDDVPEERKEARGNDLELNPRGHGADGGAWS